MNERIRLCKSIAGQHGLVVLSVKQASELSNKKVLVDTRKGEEPLVPSRPNPMKDSVQQKDLDSAKAELRARKEALKVDQLPQDDPAWVKFTQALGAYKAARESLGINPNGAQPTNNKVGDGSKRQRSTSKSPTPAARSSGFRGLLGRGTTKKSNKTESTDTDMVDL